MRKQRGDRRMALARTTFEEPGDRRILEEELLYAEIRDAIEDRMQALGMLRKDLAAAAGLTGGRISQILAGDTNLTLKTLAAIGVALRARFVATLQPTDRPISREPDRPIGLPAAAAAKVLRDRAQFMRKHFYDEPVKRVPYIFGDSFPELAVGTEPLLMASRKKYEELIADPPVLVRSAGGAS